ncbi:hypothetical protein COCNU_12G000800 [Cocos nucifera]|uniref:Uncharacterized protein n=1 Tax=Cocos nucifera TaxID=13894 RepID=A0A8K0IQM8_COCNU|nr:hypothetical protein COCNU_12G000800 [Cocos nucifera]
MIMLEKLALYSKINGERHEQRILRMDDTVASTRLSSPPYLAEGMGPRHGTFHGDKGFETMLPCSLLQSEDGERDISKCSIRCSYLLTRETMRYPNSKIPKQQKKWRRMLLTQDPHENTTIMKLFEF